LRSWPSLTVGLLNTLCYGSHECLAIAETFADLKRDGGRGFIPFITAGDPDLKTTHDLIVELAGAGATLIELGVPFTDPMADGPGDSASFTTRATS